MVRLSFVSMWVSLQMAPAASPGILGTVTELTTNLFMLDTPSADGRDLKIKLLVSWKNTTLAI